MAKRVSKKLSCVLLISVVIVTAPLWLSLALLVAVWYLVQLVVLYGVVWLWWIGPRKRRVLFVYSESPNWQSHLEQAVIPRLPPDSVVLNWSRRREWPRFALPTLLFRFFAGDRQFNPIGLVFARFVPVRRYRFWRPFRDVKHGESEPLQALEAKFFEHLAG
jgi:hypothetical protein